MQNLMLQSVQPADIIRRGERPIEGFKHFHGTTAARARGWFVVGGAWVAVVIVVVILRRGRNIEQSSAERELVGAVSVGKEAVVTNTMEPARQYVEEETADEFGDLDSHDFVPATATFPIVPPAKADVGLVEIQQATVAIATRWV
jgi:hypothetical protein